MPDDIVTNALEDIEPITRREQFLQDIADGENTLTPVTREEEFLSRIAAGGGGSGLPAITSEDEGKVLTVENGSAVWGEGEGGSILVVKAAGIAWSDTFNGLSCVMASADITAAELDEYLSDSRNAAKIRFIAPLEMGAEAEVDYSTGYSVLPVFYREYDGGVYAFSGADAYGKATPFLARIAVDNLNRYVFVLPDLL